MKTNNYLELEVHLMEIDSLCQMDLEVLVHLKLRDLHIQDKVRVATQPMYWVVRQCQSFDRLKI